MRIIEINGNNFNTLSGFYDEIEKFLMDGNCPWGRNLESLNENVNAFFNCTSIKNLNVSVIIWRNFLKSKIDLTETNGESLIIYMLEEILSANPEIKFIKQ